MRYVILIVLVLMAACSSGDNPLTTESNFRTQCVDGVIYIIFRERSYDTGAGYMTVKLGRDSKVVQCEKVGK